MIQYQYGGGFAVPDAELAAIQLTWHPPYDTTLLIGDDEQGSVNALFLLPTENRDGV